jgi:RHS repeat-associated protein
MSIVSELAYNADSRPGGGGDPESPSWNEESEELTCVNTDGETCTTPSESYPDTTNYTYNGDGLRTEASTWTDPSVVTTEFTWDSTKSSLLSDGSFDYIYGTSANDPLAEVDTTDGVVSELVTDTNSNVRGVVEVSSAADSPDTLVNYTHYDAYGNPITGSSGSPYVGGLTNEYGSDPDSASHFGFGSGYLDTTNLVYLVSRYLEPTTGQFVSVDPILNSTLQPYEYAGDDPIADVDPLGQCYDSTNGNNANGLCQDTPSVWNECILDACIQNKACLNSHSLSWCRGKQGWIGRDPLTAPVSNTVINVCATVLGDSISTDLNCLSGGAKDLTNYNWAWLMLRDGKFPRSSNDITVVMEWMASEEPTSDWWDRNNPLNNGYGSGGGAGLGAYSNLISAATFAAENILERFPVITRDLNRSAAVKVTRDAIWRSNWSASHYGYGKLCSNVTEFSVVAPAANWGA